jgi:tRNA 2-thiouridine synthesizing protein A
MSEAEAEDQLDARGLLCPLPVIRTGERIEQLPAGTVVTVTASDPGALHDIPAWCRVHGHECLVAEERDDGDCVIRVRVGGASDDG